MYPEDIFYPLSPMFSTFDGKMVNVVENAECFSRRTSHLRFMDYFSAYAIYEISNTMHDQSYE